MTKTDLIAQVAANTEMSKKDAERAVSAMFEALGKATVSYTHLDVYKRQASSSAA